MDFLARVQGKEQNGYLTIEEPFNTKRKKEILRNSHEEGEAGEAGEG